MTQSLNQSGQWALGTCMDLLSKSRMDYESFTLGCVLAIAVYVVGEGGGGRRGRRGSLGVLDDRWTGQEGW